MSDDPRILTAEQVEAIAIYYDGDSIASRDMRRLLADNAARAEREAADTALLKRLEWSGERVGCNPNNERTCPECFARWTAAETHKPGCALRARIGGG